MSPATQPVNILLVDDNTHNLVALEAVLRHPNYHLVSASSGKQALQYLMTMDFAVILLDVMMPEMDGFEFAQQVRRHHLKKYTPIVFLTASAMEHKDRRRGYAAGAVDYLTKPIDEEVVRAKVAAFVELHRKTLRVNETEAELRRLNQQLEKRAQDAVRRAEAQLRLALHAAGVAHWDWDLATDDLSFYGGLERLYGRQQSFRTFQQFVLAVHPDDRDLLRDAADRAATGEAPLDVEFRLTWPDRSLHWLAAKGAVVRDGAGKGVRLSGIHIDIDEKKRAELERRRLLEEVTRSNSELERFAAVASHDLKEPLRMITAYLGLLSKNYRGRLDRAGDEYLGFALDGAHRLRRLIDDFLQYARQTARPAHLSEVDVNEVLSNVVRGLRLRLEECEAVVTSDTLPKVFGDATQIGQLLQNVIDNALKYRREEPPRIHVGCVRKENDYLFSVRDNGIGIDMKYAHHIFQMFRRLSDAAGTEGTGIGLATCQKIVVQHGGRIWVESIPGEGSTFFFTLPGV